MGVCMSLYILTYGYLHCFQQRWADQAELFMSAISQATCARAKLKIYFTRYSFSANGFLVAHLGFQLLCFNGRVVVRRGLVDVRGEGMCLNVLEPL